jgi:hypothetical protein
VILLLGGATLCARADDAVAPVRDDAHLFTEEGVKKAGDLIREIETIYKLDVVVDTVAAPPTDQQKLFKNKNTAQVAAFFQTWARERAADAKINGIYVLICKDPVFVEATTWPEDAHAARFTPADQKQVRALLLKLNKDPKKAADNDRLLLEALRDTRKALLDNLSPPPQSFSWLAVGGVIVGLLGLWGVLAVVRMRMQAAHPAADGDAGRTGLFPGLLGGLFGTTAGHWIYDTLLLGGAHGATPPARVEVAAAPPPEGDADAGREVQVEDADETETSTPAEM